MLNLELALQMMEHNSFIEVPFATAQTPRTQIQKVLINAVGFGGNAVSILLARA
jgi:3-oxoacyl-(acyl-carrier-protein) synthase